MANRYSVYDRRTDRPVVIHARSKECAKALGIDVRSFYKKIQRSRHGRPPKRYEIFIDENEEDEADAMDSC